MSVKVVEFKDANNNTILPLAWNVGGTKIELLWTNQSPNSNFSAQTISINGSDYDLFLVTCRASGSGVSFSNENSNTTLVRKDSGGMLFGMTNNDYSARKFYVSQDGLSVTFAGGIRGYNDWCVPENIYGIKTSYVVPTEVQGLQYVEVE